LSTLKENTKLTPFELLLDKDIIAARVEELGKEITKDYAKEAPILLGVLKGCMVFMADLIRAIKLPLEVEFISAASYRQGTQRQEEVTVGGVFSIPLKGRHVLIVEGVVDTGKTAALIIDEVTKMEPASVEIVTLLDKPASHRTRLELKYKGFSIGNEFVIGYGMDNTQKYRNLPFVGRVIDS